MASACCFLIASAFITKVYNNAGFKYNSQIGEGRLTKRGLLLVATRDARCLCSAVQESGWDGPSLSLESCGAVGVGMLVGPYNHFC